MNIEFPEVRIPDTITAGFLNLGGTELFVLLFLVLLFFGGKRLPGLARSIGEGINEFKKGISGAGNDPAADEPPAERFIQRDPEPTALPAPARKPAGKQAGKKAAKAKPKSGTKAAASGKPAAKSKSGVPKSGKA